MAMTDQIFKQVVKKKGYWNYIDLYNLCFEWFQKENYILMENNYVEKLTDIGKEIVLEWEAYKKINDYFKFVIKLDWHILGMNSAEVERDGQKEKTNKGEVKITVKGELVKDYEERWEQKPLYKFMRGVYEKHVIRTTTDNYEDRLIEDAVDIHGQIKAFLELAG